MRALISIFVIVNLFLGVCYSDTYGYSIASGNFESEANQLVRINMQTGSYEALGYMGDTYKSIEGLAISRTGNLYGADDNTKTLVRVSLDSISVFPVRNVQQNLGLGNDPSQFDFGLTFGCDANLYMVTKSDQGFYRVDPNTGNASLIGRTGMSFTALASWAGKFYGIASGTQELYSIDKLTGFPTLIGSLGSLGDGDVELTNAGLSFDESGQLWMLMDLRLSDPLNPFPSRIFKIDIETGLATYVAETLVGVESLAIAPPGSCRGGGGPVAQVVPVNGFGFLITFVILLLVVSYSSLRSVRCH